MKTDLEILAQQEEKLIFEIFTPDDALDLGLLIVEHTRETINKGIAVNVVCNGVEIFRHIMEGADEENLDWIRRKTNVAKITKHSSFYSKLLINADEFDSSVFADEKEFAAYGGAFPIRLEDDEIIGFIGVSGAPDYADHQLIADSIAEYLGIKIDKLSEYVKAYGG